ncbi:ABC transporter ATP-binding protein [Oceanirhabdus sp. W0125-5]|uniref:ABC transporter ATP-binding protein n=1 Tax=Oceanirhabdus sp. W0125-5 TaxID=2999116 RepID=UPI0022F2AFED|nr:ABC transporter ATP-binding protein [Oceanirhabdus sp. W0125-5]WBW98589.1 ABC transporter ATP-binding protein [Oceanirhabdus sp. W0125-5]
MIKLGTKIENIRFVLKRWKDKDGIGGIVSCIIGIILKVVIVVFGVMLASRIVSILEKESNPKSAFLQIIAVVCLYAFLRAAGELFIMKMHISTFLYRILEMPDLFFKLVKLPFNQVEGSAGKQEFEKASEAVSEGNHIGVEALIKNVSELVVNIFCLAVFMIISAKLNPLIMLVLLFTGYMRTFKDRKNRKWILENQDKRNKLMYERIYLHRKCLDTKIGKDVRIYGMEKWFADKFQNLLETIMVYVKIHSKNTFLAECIQHISGVLRDLICYSYLIYRVSQGMALSEFVLYLGVIAGFNVWIKNIFDEYAKLGENAIVVNNFRIFLEKQELGEGEYDKAVPKAKGYSYVFENVSFGYEGGKEIFHNLNLTINEGEKIALVGANGAGKTTLVKLMCGLYKPQKGRILLNGVDISKVNLKELLRLTGVVFQETKVFPESIAKNISCRLDEEVNIKRLNESLKQADFYDYVQKMPNKEKTVLTKNLEETGIELSGGQYQKLMLARAVYKNAPILILDEPTAALDPLAEAEMYKKYDQLTKGKTSVFISHRLSSTQFCDRVIFLQDGSIKQDGCHGELIKENGPYREMFNAQAHYYQEEVASCKC